MPGHDHRHHSPLNSTAHTCLHRTRLPLTTWGRGVELILARPETTAYSLQRALGLGGYRTAWRLARIIREALLAVEWPLLTGEVEFCDVNLAAQRDAPKSIWIAMERRPAPNGLIRAWRGSLRIRDDLRRVAIAFDPAATVITSPWGVFREFRTLGFRHRSEPLGTAEAFPAATAAATAFRRTLQDRRHHCYATATIEAYLGEFVFRQNAAALGWSPVEQGRRVMALLRTPRSSA